MIGLQSATLLHCPSGQRVRASFVGIRRQAAQDEIDATWWSEIAPKLGKREAPEDDEHWSWAAIADQFGARGGWCVGLRTDDGRMQGAVAYAATRATQSEEGSVHIGWIATAPWNRTWLFDPPEYRGTGRALLLYAAAHSYLLGLRGRLALNALPRERTRRFYEERGFRVAGQNEDGTIAMVLAAQDATAWLEREGVLG